jgi:hypothetical protein
MHHMHIIVSRVNQLLDRDLRCEGADRSRRGSIVGREQDGGDVAWFESKAQLRQAACVTVPYTVCGGVKAVTRRH